MIECAKIYIRAVPDSTPDDYLDEDGNLCIDLPSEFSFTQERTAEKLNNINKLQISGTLGFSAPRTPKNDWIFSQYTDIMNLDSPAPRVFVTAVQGMYPVTQEILQINGCDRSDWDLELIEFEEHWATKSKEKLLNTIELGEFLLTKQNILDQQDIAAYVDTGDVIQFPACNYGKGNAEGQAVIADMRPWHYPLPVLVQGFCEIGYKFSCPFLESDIGRKHIAYILDEGFDTNPEFLKQREFLAQIEDWEKTYSSLVTESDIIIFTDVIYDPSGGYSLITGGYSGLGTFTFKFQAKVRLLGHWRIEIVKFIPSLNGDEVITSTEIIQKPFPKNHMITLETGEIDLLIGEEVKVKVVHIGEIPGLFNPVRQDFFRVIDIPATFSNKCIRTSFMSGDTIDVMSLVDPDYTLFDFLAGITHILNGRIDFNELTKEVTLYSPYTVDIDGSTIDGYYRNNVGYNDLRVLQVRKGERLSTNARNQNKKVLLAFKNSDDVQVKKLNLPDTAPLYSMTIDMGGNRPKGTTELKNPFFEPTLNDFTDIYNGVLYLPHLLDNEDGNRSYRIGPRILIYAGRVAVTRAGAGSPMAFRFEDTGYFIYPYAYQLIRADLVTVPGITSEYELVYGDRSSDAYRKFWSRMLAEEYNGSFIELTTILSQAQFTGWSFRDEYLARFNDQDFMGRVLSIGSFKGCRRDTSKVSILAQLQISSECAEEPMECENQPTLSIDLDADTYTFTSGGTVDSPIEEEIIEWRYADDEEWTVGTELIGATGPFYVRLTQRYSDGCSDKVIIKFIDPCGNYPELIITQSTNAFGENVYTVEIGGTITSTIDTETITYTIDGGAPVNYTDPFVAPVGVELCITGSLTFTDSCAAWEDTQCFDVVDDGVPPDDSDECYWVRHTDTYSSGSSIPAPPDPYQPGNPPVALPDPSTVTDEIISKRVIVFRDGRKLIYMDTPTQVGHFGIDYANQEITFGKPLTGNEIEVYVYNCPGGDFEPDLGSGYWMPYYEEFQTGSTTDAPPDIYKPGNPPVVLSDPGTVSIEQIRKTNVIYRDGRKLIFKISPTTVDEFGIDFALQQFTYGKPKTGSNKIEIYVWQNY